MIRPLHTLLIFFFLFAFCRPGYSQSSLDKYITGQMATNKVPGLSACIVKNGRLAWAGGYGYANLDLKIPATPQTVFMLASISKTVTATAFLQLYEKGLVQLDDSIDAFLPFRVRNPNYPNVPITFRQLMTHTSGIKDNYDVIDANYSNGDSPIPLEDYLRNYLVPGGDNYDAAKNFQQHAPGNFAEYCNIGATLLGYLTERISGKAFDQYTKESILTPLCMQETAWFLKDLDTTHIARPYAYTGGKYVDLGLYGYPDYPDGQLRTSAISLAKFADAILYKGNFNGTPLLKSSTVKEMLTVQNAALDPSQGLIWANAPYNGRTLWGHTGGDAGVSTELFLDTGRNEGVIILTNGNQANLNNILIKLMTVADTIRTTGKPMVNCALTASINEEERSEQNIILYPNPAESRLTIEGLPGDAAVAIFTLTGQQVSCNVEHNSPAFSVDVSSLPAGMYIFQAASGNTICRRKFIISR